MRYRRVGHRYEVMLTTRRAFAWQTTELAIAFAPPRWRPNVDVCETSRALVVTVELAGIDAEEVEILLYENALIVQGERPVASCGADGVYHEVEIRRGPFRLELALPVPIDADGVEARQEQGMLRIALPKVEG